MSLVDTLANAIATFEGFFRTDTSTLAQRNNNPGNLRSGPGQVGVDANGYAVFPTLDAGWQALYNQIALDTARGLTVSQFMGKYAPPSENDTNTYTNYVIGQLGVSADTPLSALNTGNSPPNFPTSPLRSHSRAAERPKREPEPAA